MIENLLENIFKKISKQKKKLSKLGENMSILLEML